MVQDIVCGIRAERGHDRQRQDDHGGSGSESEQCAPSSALPDNMLRLFQFQKTVVDHADGIYKSIGLHNSASFSKAVCSFWRVRYSIDLTLLSEQLRASAISATD